MLNIEVKSMFVILNAIDNPTGTDMRTLVHQKSLLSFVRIFPSSRGSPTANIVKANNKVIKKVIMNSSFFLPWAQVQRADTVQGRNE